VVVVDAAGTRGTETTVVVDCGGCASGVSVDVEGSRAPSLSITTGIGGSTGGPSPPIAVALEDAETGIGVGTGATIEAVSVRLIRSPETSSSFTAWHAQRMSRAHSSTSGKRMRKCSSWTTSVNARTVVAKKVRVSVDGIGAVALEDSGVQVGDGEGEAGKVEDEDEEAGRG
jgi:hypothetical protein